MAEKKLLKKAEAHAHAGRTKEAERICNSILKKNPAHQEAMFLLSGLMLLEKKYKACEPLLRKVLAANPNHISAMNNLGIVYREYHKDLEAARALFEKVVAGNPGHFRALMNLGNIYSDYGQYEQSEHYYKKALEVNPGAKENAVFLTHLGNICYRKKDYDGAISYFKQGLAQDPGNTDILRNFILARYGQGDRLALMSMVKEVAALPDLGRACFPVFSVARRNCFWAVSEKTAPKAVALALQGIADYAALEMSNLDFLAVKGLSYADLLEIHRITGRMLESKRMRAPYVSHEKAFENRSKLKIGYLSGDFRAHVINTFVRGLFNFHDRDRFELYCYSSTEIEDNITKQYREAADVFLDVGEMSNHEIAQKIHEDGIHLLVNIAGYTKDSRMEVMAYRAAPVQIMYLGYPYTSGLSTVDYFISDPYLDGPENAQYFAEKQLRLPECFATFERLNDRKMTGPPFKAHGHITFGSLVNPYKLGPDVVRVWSEIMRELPDSRIMLNHPKYGFDQMQRNILDEFNRHGIEDARVDIVFERHPSSFHLRYYNAMDIALDTFPLTGGTTTHEALWMGVPVVTLVGDIYPHRLSYTILSNAGMDLSELIAFSESEYRDKVLALARKPERIEALHHLIPNALDASIQCDPIRHTRQMERAYIEAWNQKFPMHQIEWLSEISTPKDLRAMLEKAVASVKRGEMNQGKTLCRKIFKIDPENIEALNLLGTIHLMEKNYKIATECFETVLSVYPEDIKALNNLGLVCLEYDRDLDQARMYFERVLAHAPDHLNARMNLGNVYRALHRLQNAEDHYKKALEIDPENGNVLNNLGSLSVKRGYFAQAKAYYERAQRRLPHQPEVLSNLMAVNRIMGKHDQAADLVPQVLKMSKPGGAVFPAYGAAKSYCLWDAAAQLLPQVQELIWEADASFGGLIEQNNLSLLATPGLSSETLFEIHKKTGTIVDQRREGAPFVEYPRAMQKRDKIRIGYLSPDLYRHVLNAGFRGLMSFHDPSRFEIYCYSNSNIEDEVTAQYRAKSSAFVNVTGLSDRELAERIWDDGIHFLVDLAGYTTNTRIGVMSYRPAPVQLMYLGYSYTSGLSSVDYFITDPYLDGPDNARYFTEKQLRLPESFFAVGHLADAHIEKEIPFTRNAAITFGSMNNTYKLSPELISVWAEILKEVPNAKLVLNHPNMSQLDTRENILFVFKENGVDLKRIEMIWDPHPEGSHLLYYNDFDIVLDSFPVTGGTSTIEAVWMGVPVISLVGEIYPHRLSYSILKNIGLNVDDLIAFDRNAYIRKAVALAKQPERISELHQKIPRQLRKSIFCDPYRLTRQMEAAYIRGWNEKFPDRPIEMEIEDKTVTTVPVRGNVDIAVPDSIDDPDRYILAEQAGWFDPEYDFLRKILQAGMKVLDVDAGIGSFAIPLARKVGSEGICWAVAASETEAQYLHYSKTHNDLTSLKIGVRAAAHYDFAKETQAMDRHDLDFVRIGSAKYLDRLFLTGIDLLNKNSPLMMFRVKSEAEVIATEAVSRFKALGYQAYRFVPGLQLLVPFESDRELDAFALNLFACKADRADKLDRQGVLLTSFSPLAELPGFEEKLWHDYIAACPYASALIDDWKNHPVQRESWENYRIALNLFAQSKEASNASSVRYAALNSSFGLLAMILKTKVTLPRLFSMIRVMLELGKREASIRFLNQILARFESGEKIEMNEPFLALSDEDASVDPAADFAQWLFASVLKTREKNRAFSTYFSETEALPILKAIRDTEFGNAQIDGQIKLIHERFPQLKSERFLENKKASTC